MAQSPILPSPVVRARRLELVDEHGEIKITLDAQETGSVMRLWGKDRRVKASFGLLTTDQPALLLLDGYLPRVDLRLEEDGHPSLGMVDNRSLELCELLMEAAKKQMRQTKRKAKKAQAQSTRKEG